MESFLKEVGLKTEMTGKGRGGLVRQAGQWGLNVRPGGRWRQVGAGPA